MDCLDLRGDVSPGTAGHVAAAPNDQVQPVRTIGGEGLQVLAAHADALFLVVYRFQGVQQLSVSAVYRYPLVPFLLKARILRFFQRTAVIECVEADESHVHGNVDRLQLGAAGEGPGGDAGDTLLQMDADQIYAGGEAAFSKAGDRLRQRQFPDRTAAESVSRETGDALLDQQRVDLCPVFIPGHVFCLFKFPHFSGAADGQRPAAAERPVHGISALTVGLHGGVEDHAVEQRIVRGNHGDIIFPLSLRAVVVDLRKLVAALKSVGTDLGDAGWDRDLRQRIAGIKSLFADDAQICRKLQVFQILIVGKTVIPDVADAVVDHNGFRSLAYGLPGGRKHLRIVLHPPRTGNAQHSAFWVVDPGDGAVCSTIVIHWLQHQEAVPGGIIHLKIVCTVITIAVCFDRVSTYRQEETDLAVFAGEQLPVLHILAFLLCQAYGGVFDCVLSGVACLHGILIIPV